MAGKAWAGKLTRPVITANGRFRRAAGTAKRLCSPGAQSWFLDGMEGMLTNAKWAAIGQCSADTALRDINDLIGLQPSWSVSRQLSKCSIILMK